MKAGKANEGAEVGWPKWNDPGPGPGSPPLIGSAEPTSKAIGYAIPTLRSVNPVTPDPFNQMRGDIGRYFDSIEKQNAATLQQQLGDIGVQGSVQGRRASEMNAQLGGTLGGGAFASGQAQVGVGNTLARGQAIKETNVRSLESKMKYLDYLYNGAKDRGDHIQMKEIENLRGGYAKEIAKISGETAVDLRIAELSGSDY